MYFLNNQRLHFTRAITVVAWMCLYTGVYHNEVYAASLRTTGNIKDQEHPCEETCNTLICGIEAVKLKLTMDESIDPCEDFYQFACGKFIKRHNFSDESTSISRFSIWRSYVDNDVRSVIQQVNASYGRPYTMLKSYYQSCLNQENDIGSVLKIFDNIGGFPLLFENNWSQANYSWKESLYKAVVNEKFQTSIPVFFFVNSTTNIVLVMNARRIINSSLNKNLLLTYYQFAVASIEALAQNKNISKKDVLDLVKFEIKLNTIMTTYERIANEAVTNIQGVMIIKDQKFIKELDNLITETPKRTVANYIAWDILKTIYLYLPKQFDHVKKKYDLNQFKTREQFCLNEVKNSFTVALDALYVRKFIVPKFHQEMNEDVRNLVQNIKKQIETDIEKAEWVDNNTRKTALKKLNSMRISISYAEELMDENKVLEYYRKLNLKNDGFFKSSIALGAFKVENYYTSLIEPLNNISWTRKHSATLIDAKYDYNKNLIDIPAAFLQQFIYTYDRPKYMNYGALGTIMGHEIMHGFDNLGRKYDENGNLKNWWAKNTEKNYLQKVQCFVDQYGSFRIPKKNLNINGMKTQNENIADNEGFKAAYHAYNEWAEINGMTEKCLPNLHYTPKQMFWISSATSWCSNDGVKYLQNFIDSDPHSPYIARVMLSFANMKEFAEDFKCKVGSRMNPIRKCTLW